MVGTQPIRIGLNQNEFQNNCYSTKIIWKVQKSFWTHRRTRQKSMPGPFIGPNDFLSHPKWKFLGLSETFWTRVKKRHSILECCFWSSPKSFGFEPKSFGFDQKKWTCPKQFWNKWKRSIQKKGHRLFWLGMTRNLLVWYVLYIFCSKHTNTKI